MAVFGCPAAGAVQVAGARGVDKYRPRDIALLFFAHLSYFLRAAESGLIAEVQGSGFNNIGTDLVEYTVDINHPFAVRVVDYFSCAFIRRARHCIAHEFLRKIHNGVKRLVSVLICLFEYGIGSDRKSRSSGFVG